MELTAAEHLFTRWAGHCPERVTPLQQSGSSRTYCRVTGHGRSAIFVHGDSPEENRAFIYLSAHLRGRGVNVPEVYLEDGQCYLQEDLGTLSLHDALAAGRLSGAYSPEEEQLLVRTISCLPKIQFEGARGMDWNVCYPDKEFNARMVDFDLNYFKYCFLKVYGAPFNETMLQDDFDSFKADLLSVESDTLMYRDFQPRNVMLRDGAPWFIDFQGGRRGPIYYDVASFVHQARASYPQALKDKLTDAYLSALSRYLIIGREEFMTRLRPFVLFRLLQVLGAYGYRGLIEHKAMFSDAIPLAIKAAWDLLPTGYDYIDSIISSLKLPQGAAPSSHQGRLEVEVNSFSYREGYPSENFGNGGGYVFDCRAIHNPGRYDEYRSLTGKDAPVIQFLEQGGEMKAFLDRIFPLADTHIEKYLGRGFEHLQLSFGCTGGCHRSVYAAEAMAHHIVSKYPGVRVHLRHLARGQEEYL